MALNFPKPSIILKGPENWDPWLGYVRSIAWSHDVWQYADPSKAKVTLERPTESESAADMNYQEFLAKKKAMGNLMIAIRGSITTLIATGIENETEVYETMSRLHKRYGPSKEEEKKRFLNQYEEVKKGPKDSDLHDFATKWDNVITKAEKIDGYKERDKLFWASEFVDSLAGWNDYAHTLLKAGIIHSEADFDKTIRHFRDIIPTIPKTTRKGRYNATFGATLRGSPSQTNYQQNSPSQHTQHTHPSQNTSTYKRKCICGYEHWYGECPYSNPAVRPPRWVPVPEIAKKVEEKMRNNPDLRNRVKRSIEITNQRRTKMPTLQTSNHITEENNNDMTTHIAPTPSHSSTSPDQTNRNRQYVSMTAITMASNFADTDHLKEVWILDSGSTIHVCNDAKYFISFDRQSSERVYHGNTSSQIEAYGTVHLLVTMPNGKKEWFVLKNVAYVPNFIINIVSYHLARKAGYWWHGKNDYLYDHQDQAVVQLHLQFNHWIIKHETPSDVHLSHPLISYEYPVSQATRQLWHQRLGHPNLNIMDKLELAVQGVKITDKHVPHPNSLCQSCELSKSHELVSRRPSPKGDYPFERLHFDLMYATPAYNGDNYVFHSYDASDGFHMTWCLDNKTEANLLSCLQNAVEIANSYGHNTRYIHIDGEVSLGTKSYHWASQKGIHIEVSSPHTPAQNAPIERAGRTIIEKARTTRIECGMDERYWPEFVRDATYKANRTPVQRLNWRTPIEFITGRRPYLGHIRKILSRAYVHRKDVQKSHKLEERADLGWLMGFEGSNIYRVWIPHKNRVIRSRDVRIDETVQYSGEQSEIEPRLQIAIDEILDIIEIPTHEPPQLFEHVETPDPSPRPPVPTRSSDTSTVRGCKSDSNENPLPTPRETPPLGQNEDTENNTIIQSSEDISDPPLTHTRHQRRPRDTSEGLSEQAIIPTNEPYAIRSRVKHSHAIDVLRTTEDPLFALYSAFSVSQEKPRVHRDQLPSPPKTYAEFLRHPHQREFRQAMDVEFNTLESRGTFKKVPKSDNIAIIPTKWVWTYKFDEKGYLIKFKARIVARGDLQPMNNQEVYASTLALKTFRTLLAIICNFDWITLQLDAVNAFVHVPIDQLVHVAFPPGLEGTDNILQLLRALYGLRTSPLLWLKDLTSTMRRLDFMEVPDDPCLFVHNSKPIMAFFYVDDIVLTSPEDLRQELYHIRDQLMKSYEIREIGPLNHFLGARVIRDRKARKLWLTQADYIEKITKKFHLEHATVTHVPLPMESIPKWDQQASTNQITGYQQRVGSALWAAIFSRPDIARACSLLSEHNTNPSPQARRGIDQVLAYLNSTKDLAIEFCGGPFTDQHTGFIESNDIDQCLRVSSDAAYADDTTTRRSTQGMLITLFNGPIAWKSTRQKTVTTSTTEAELLALSHTAKELIALQRFLNDITFDPGHQVHIACDNKQTIGLMTKDHPQFTTKLKHVDIHRFWLRQEVREGHIHLEWTPTNSMSADGLTKILPRQQHEKFVKMLNLVDITDKLKQTSSNISNS